MRCAGICDLKSQVNEPNKASRLANSNALRAWEPIAGTPTPRNSSYSSVTEPPAAAIFSFAAAEKA
ncbi:hypothetical protein GCM10012289_47690 [Nonomuraea cavernae]|uniref:Uncharacterized protein n=1 Tax=Nonomuraea cavernae TaxID=2045107 RepID=A0A918DNC4_9ACTN|nr:hypothetical protein GCM10012289_47690 [Nonomuraea cavernae]